MLWSILLVDRALGEPPSRFHPVEWFGRAERALERRLYGDSVARGAAHWLLLVGAATSIGALLEAAFGRRLAVVAAGTISVSGRMLADEVGGVGRALAADDLPLARERLSRVVGRETERLDEHGAARAAIETMAENTVDAVTAPLFWAAVGGAPAVLAHRAINTLDAVVGHRDGRYERFGKFAARADDVANWVPARLTVLAVAMLRPEADVFGTVRRDAGRHPSPNGGAIEAAYAGALGISLGGVNRYADRVENRGALGDGAAPTRRDIGRAVSLSRRAWWLVAALLTAPSAVRWYARRRG